MPKFGAISSHFGPFSLIFRPHLDGYIFRFPVQFGKKCIKILEKGVKSKKLYAKTIKMAKND